MKLARHFLRITNVHLKFKLLTSLGEGTRIRIQTSTIQDGGSGSGPGCPAVNINCQNLSVSSDDAGCFVTDNVSNGLTQTLIRRFHSTKQAT